MIPGKVETGAGDCSRIEVDLDLHLAVEEPFAARVAPEFDRLYQTLRLVALDRGVGEALEPLVLVEQCCRYGIFQAELRLEPSPGTVVNQRRHSRLRGLHDDLGDVGGSNPVRGQGIECADRPLEGIAGRIQLDRKTSRHSRTGQVDGVVPSADQPEPFRQSRGVRLGTGSREPGGADARVRGESDLKGLGIGAEGALDAPAAGTASASAVAVSRADSPIATDAVTAAAGAPAVHVACQPRA